MIKGNNLFISIMLISTALSCFVDKKERILIDCWIKEHNLNKYGDPTDTVYAGGTPLFDEATGTYIDQYAYLYRRHPDKPWDFPAARETLATLKESQQLAEKEIHYYVQKNSLDDVLTMITALSSYKSWYQSPLSFPANLSPAIQELLLRIKTIADESFKQHAQLTCFGDIYFMTVNEMAYNMLVKKSLSFVKRSLLPYLRTTNLKDLETLQEYLSYYRSWYQSVTPAPRKIQESLSPQAKKMLSIIKTTADNYFTQEPAQHIPGASRLSMYGMKYYAKIHAWLANKIDHKRRKAYVHIIKSC